MSRWRRIRCALWTSEKFRALSSPSKPSGQFLLLFLKSGPFTGLIPGLVVAGEAALAEALGWSLAAFRKAFAELAAAGLAHMDPVARLVYLPDEVTSNPPASPNVALSWARAFEEIPECTLRKQAWANIEAFLSDQGEAFRKAFAEPSEKPSRKALANQEQYQEKDQEKDSPPNPPRGDSGAEDGFEDFWALYPRKEGRKVALLEWRKIQPLNGLSEQIIAAIKAQKSNSSWRREGGRFVPKPARWLKERLWEDEQGQDPNKVDAAWEGRTSGEVKLR